MTVKSDKAMILVDSCATPRLEWVPAWLQTLLFSLPLRVVLAPAGVLHRNSRAAANLKRGSA